MLQKSLLLKLNLITISKNLNNKFIYPILFNKFNNSIHLLKNHFVTTKYFNNNNNNSQTTTPIESTHFHLHFKCKKCNTTNLKKISKKAYYEGVVLCQCDGCENRHLIADNLGWFRDGKIRLDTLAKESGTNFKRLKMGEDGVLQILEEIENVEKEREKEEELVKEKIE